MNNGALDKWWEQEGRGAGMEKVWSIGVIGRGKEQTSFTARGCSTEY